MLNCKPHGPRHSTTADLVLLGASSLEGLNRRVEPATKRLLDAGPAPAAITIAAR